MKICVPIPALLIVLVFSGCATTYIPPSGRADFAAFTSANLRDSFALAPAAQFPAALVFVRLQEPGYYNYYVDQSGSVVGDGRYAVITARELGEDVALARLRSLPRVSGIAGLNRMLLPSGMNSDEDLRAAAARLKADMVVLYTFETTFRDRDHSGPLTVISLGIFATKEITLNVTASALVVDTRTGFIYAALETTEQREFNASLWSERQKADLARQEAERAAFGKLVDEFEKNWGLIVLRASEGA